MRDRRHTYLYFYISFLIIIVIVLERKHWFNRSFLIICPISSGYRMRGSSLNISSETGEQGGDRGSQHPRPIQSKYGVVTESRRRHQIWSSVSLGLPPSPFWEGPMADGWHIPPIPISCRFSPLSLCFSDKFKKCDWSNTYFEPINFTCVFKFVRIGLPKRSEKMSRRQD